MDLLNQYLALATDEERATFLAGLTDEQLAELNSAAAEQFEALEADAASDENIASLTAVADTLEAVAGQIVERENHQAQLEADRQAQIERVRGQGDPEPGADPEAEPTPTDPPADPEADPEADPAADPEADPANAGTPTPSAVAASADPAAAVLPVARPRIDRVVARRAPAAIPGTRGAAQPAALVAAADIPSMAAGQVLVAPGSRDFSELSAAFVARANSLKGSKQEGRFLVASAAAEYPEDRQLDLNSGLNAEKVAAMMRAAAGGPESLVAAGGFCAPATVRYELPTLGDTERPVRDDMPNFGAPRGRVRWMPSPTVADVAGGVSQWTEADDISALTDDSVVKPCVRLTCPDELEVELYAVTKCLTIGNFNARTYAEQVQAYNDLMGVYSARFAEELLLAGIDAGSQTTNFGQVLSTTPDFFDNVNRICVWFESFYRIREPRIRLIVPELVHDWIRSDLARMLPGTGTMDERYAIADAQIDRWLAARNVVVTWTLDEAVVPDQIGNGPFWGFPSTVKVRAYLEGTWFYLDGGTLDLGIIRDSILAATNDFQQFAEVFEQVAKFGPGRSFVGTMDLCASGATSGTVDLDPCTSGS